MKYQSLSGVYGIDEAVSDRIFEEIKAGFAECKDGARVAIGVVDKFQLSGRAALFAGYVCFLYDVVSIPNLVWKP